MMQRRECRSRVCTWSLFRLLILLVILSHVRFLFGWVSLPQDADATRWEIDCALADIASAVFRSVASFASPYAALGAGRYSLRCRVTRQELSPSRLTVGGVIFFQNGKSN
jgi:hypothetical protein